jgi:ribosomal 50S subunit-recycling heat shock protein
MSANGPAETICCPVIELRQYTLKTGQRDALIDLFERHFIESQEATGMTLVGQFRDRRRPDRFVWLRGFPNMERRHQALDAFYGGPVWSAHRSAANSTMVDSNDVLLLRPARPDLAFRISMGGDAPSRDRTPATVLAGIYQMPRPVDTRVVSAFERQVVPILLAHRVKIEGVFVTESAPNTFTRLPVRDGENVLVWFGVVQGEEVTPAGIEQLTRLATLDEHTMSLLELEPTARSTLSGGAAAARASKHDFDFLFGSWNIHNRYLKGRLRHSTEWGEFDARSQVEPLLDGFGHLDRYSAVRDGTPFEGITLRLFDPATGEWSIHWADTAQARTLLPPMVGRFTRGVGEFYGDEMVDGKKVSCRFLWTRPTSDSARWEQAFSDDGGKTWETNWIMTFTRP